MPPMQNLFAAILYYICCQIAYCSIFQVRSAYSQLEFKKLTAQQALVKIDIQNSREFWIYLRSPKRIYQSHKVHPNKYTYFILYDSTVGLFLSISSYDLQTGIVNITSLIRIGNLIPNLQQKHIVNLQPIVVGMRIASSFYLIKINGDGQMIIDNQIVQIRNEVESYSDQRTRIIDIYIKRQFWHYLYAARIREIQIIRSDKDNCIFIQYVHKNQIYLTIADLNSHNQLEVTTFAKLGKLHKNIETQLNSKKTLTEIEPKVIQLN